MDKIQGTNTAVASSISLLTHDVEKLRIQNTQLVRVSCADKFDTNVNPSGWMGVQSVGSSFDWIDGEGFLGARLSGTIVHGQHRACGHGDQLAWNSF